MMDTGHRVPADRLERKRFYEENVHLNSHFPCPAFLFSRIFRSPEPGCFILPPSAGGGCPGPLPKNGHHEAGRRGLHAPGGAELLGERPEGQGRGSFCEGSKGQPQELQDSPPDWNRSPSKRGEPEGG